MKSYIVFFIIVILVIALIIGILLFKCNSNNTKYAPEFTKDPMLSYIPDIESLDDGQLMIDYFERSVATINYTSDGQEVEPGHYEITLSKHNSTQVRLDIYTRDNSASEENQITYYVPIKVLKDVYRIIDKNNMRKWNSDKNGSSLSGKFFVCKFYYKDGLVRVTSDNMPEDGKDVFNEIHDTLSSYIPPEHNSDNTD
ncbi:MAG: hypothetical protein Q4D35_06970 [Ruminococcus sp.]|nr:hypothetical protein [Ruminococcus sp.]